MEKHQSPDPPSLKRYDHRRQETHSRKPKVWQEQAHPPASIPPASLGAPEPTEVPSPWAAISPCPACYLLSVFQCLGDTADERKTALGTAQLFAPALAWLLSAMINTGAALAFGDHGGDAEAGAGCRVTVTLACVIRVPRWELSLCGPLGCRADVTPEERSQGGCKYPQPVGAGSRGCPRSSGSRTLEPGRELALPQVLADAPECPGSRMSHFPFRSGAVGTVPSLPAAPASPGVDRGGAGVRSPPSQ